MSVFLRLCALHNLIELVFVCIFNARVYKISDQKVDTMLKLMEFHLIHDSLQIHS